MFNFLILLNLNISKSFCLFKVGFIYTIQQESYIRLPNQIQNKNCVLNVWQALTFWLSDYVLPILLKHCVQSLLYMFLHMIRYRYKSHKMEQCFYILRETSLKISFPFNNHFKMVFSETMKFLQKMFCPYFLVNTKQ